MLNYQRTNNLCFAILCHKVVQLEFITRIYHTYCLASDWDSTTDLLRSPGTFQIVNPSLTQGGWKREKAFAWCLLAGLIIVLVLHMWCKKPKNENRWNDF